MTISAFVSTRAEVLVPLLAERLLQTSKDPFQADVIVVPSAAYQNWLSEQLAKSLICPDGSPGILANVHFLLPAEFYSLVQNQSEDPAPPALWGNSLVVAGQLLALLCEKPSMAPSFQDVVDRMAYAMRVTQLFERYSIERPDMLAAWAHGDATDGVGPLPQAFRWQFDLWNELSGRLAKGKTEASTSKLKDIREADTKILDEIDRVTLFGLEVLSPRAVRVLKSLSATKNLVVFGTTPSRQIIETGQRLAKLENYESQPKRSSFSDDIDSSHPLLRSWASSAYESAFLLSLLTSDVTFKEQEHSSALLGVVQEDLATGANLDQVAPAAQLSDGSIELHRCHGIVRQVEVARDAILHILDRDPSLTLRDVLVVSPDIDRIAQLIQPIFGIAISAQSSSQTKMQLPIALLDGAAVDSSDVSQIILNSLSLVGSRCTRTEVKTLLNIEAVRISMGFDSEALEKIDRWLNEIDVRWGLSSMHREEFGYPSGVQIGTWSWALQRLIAGAYVQAPEPIEFTNSITPYDDIGSGDLHTLANFVSFLGLFTDLQEFGAKSQSLVDWVKMLARLVESLIPNEPDFADDHEDVEFVFQQLSMVTSVVGGVKFSARELRSLLEGQFQGRRSPSRQWGDVVRVGSLRRMRGLPARVIVLLGIDESALSAGTRDGDDILAQTPRIGERDSRADERLALLTTVAAASDHLVITSNGFSVTNNESISPSIPQVEFIEVVRRSIGARDSKAMNLDIPLIVSHSRQLAHPINLGVPSERKEKSVFDFVGGPWTFDSSAEVLAKSGLVVAEEFGDLTSIELSPPGAEEFERGLRLGNFSDAIRRPLRVLIQSRLRVRFPDEEAAPAEDLMLWPDGLERAALGREWIALYQQGFSHDQITHRFTLTGRLPPMQLGIAFTEQMRSEIDEMVEKSGGIPKNSEVIDLNIEHGKFQIRDQVVLGDGELRVIDYVRYHEGRLAIPWITIAALVRQLSGKNITARVVARSGDTKNKTPVLTIMQIKGDDDASRLAAANQVLDYGIKLLQNSMCRVIPIFERASWAVAVGASESKVKEALKRDIEKPEYVWAGYLPSLDDLNLEKAMQNEESHFAPELSRFMGYATELRNIFTSTTTITEEQRD